MVVSEGIEDERTGAGDEDEDNAIEVIELPTDAVEDCNVFITRGIVGCGSNS